MIDHKKVVSLHRKYNRFMKYKLQQETKPKLSPFGKYKAVAVHQQTVGTKEITEECVEKKKHIRGARIHFIPESIDGVQDLYDGIDYERVKE